MNSQAVRAFMKAMIRRDVDYKGEMVINGPFTERQLAHAMHEAFVLMYTENYPVSITHDPESGELFVVMKYGEVWKYTEQKSSEVVSEAGGGKELEWEWVKMPPIPGTVASGGAIEPGYPPAIPVNQNYEPAPAHESPKPSLPLVGDQFGGTPQ